MSEKQKCGIFHSYPQHNTTPNLHSPPSLPPHQHIPITIKCCHTFLQPSFPLPPSLPLSAILTSAGAFCLLM